MVINIAALAGCAPELATNGPPRRPWNEPREQLDKADIVYGMQQRRGAVGASFDRYRTTGQFNVAATIVGEGHVSRFTGAPQSIVYPFILR
jgi:hypothetical protein